MKTQQFQKALTFALPMDHYKKIKQITDDEKISIAEWVRDAVAAALKNNKREEETMK